MCLSNDFICTSLNNNNYWYYAILLSLMIVRIETLSTEELSFHIHLLICLWVWTHVYWFYSMAYTPVLSLFCHSNCFRLGHWELLQAVFCSLLTCPWPFLSIYLLSSTGGAVVKPPATNAGDARDVGLIPGLGRCTGEGNDNPLQYSCLEIPWTGEPGGTTPWVVKESDTTEWLSTNARCSRLFLYFPCPRPGTNHTTKHLAPFRNEDLSIRWTHSHRCHASRPSEWPEHVIY